MKNQSIVKYNFEIYVRTQLIIGNVEELSATIGTLGFVKELYK